MNIQKIKVDPQSDLGCSPSKITILKHLIHEKLLDSEDNYHILIYNFDHYGRQMKELIQTFPKHWKHTMALKSNMLPSCLLFAKEQGLGFEAASLGELTAALRTGIDPSWIVFDSPVKTISELKLSLQNGVYLNIDNFQELARVKELVNSGMYSQVRVGLRINPQVGLGKIPEMSVASDVSKFGIGYLQYKSEILQAYRENSWLTGIHLHSGSQGIPIEMMINGVERILELLVQINKQRGSKQIEFVDIGGGLPVNFDSELDWDEDAVSFEKYCNLLNERCPLLFNGDVTVLTEFGRRLNAKSAFYVSRVEYTKLAGTRHIAAIHGGADFFMRTVFMPQKWAIRLSVCDSQGNLRQGARQKQDIAGPCCFASDIVGHERELPLVNQGDFILAHDVGAYYYSSYCFYNARQLPAVYSVTFNSSGFPQFSLIKRAQSVNDTLDHYFKN